MIDLAHELPGQSSFDDALFTGQSALSQDRQSQSRTRKTGSTTRTQDGEQQVIDFEWEELVATGDKPDPKFLQIGDVIAIHQTNSFEEKTWRIVKGTLCAIGFWDGRDRKQPDYYFLDLESSYFRVFNPCPRCSDWVRIGFDETYEPPRKDNILEVMVEHLSAVPLKDRINALHQVEMLYPYTSWIYHPLVSSAWEQGILQVTTEDEYLEYLRTARKKLPKVVANWVAKELSPLPVAERKRIIPQIRYKNQYFAEQFRDKSCTYWEPLNERALKSATGQDLANVLAQLSALASIKSEEAPGTLWLESVEGVQVLIP